jgi:hypothetical protein
MKKITILSLVLFSALLFVACGGKGDGQLHNIRGIVKHVHLTSDSIPVLTLGIEDGDSLVFTLADAKIQNGILMHSDSVIVDYIGGDDALRALVVTILPKPIKPSVLKHDTLLTVPADSTSRELGKVPVKK